MPRGLFTRSYTISHQVCYMSCFNIEFFLSSHYELPYLTLFLKGFKTSIWITTELRLIFPEPVDMMMLWTGFNHWLNKRGRAYLSPRLGIALASYYQVFLRGWLIFYRLAPYQRTPSGGLMLGYTKSYFSTQLGLRSGLMINMLHINYKSSIWNNNAMMLLHEV